MPEISVVLAVYNPDPQFFCECLDSILAQSIDDFEIIISDDAPNGQIEQLLRQYSSEKIKYLRNPAGKGIFSNFNHALHCASGEYLQVFCQDDRMYPNYLAEQRRVLQKYPGAGFVYAQCDVIDERGGIKEPCAYPGKAEKPDMPVPRSKAINCFFKYGCLPGNLSTVMIRRKLFEELGPFDVNYPFAADFRYWVDAIRRYDFAINLVPLLGVRSHEKQASRTLGAVQWATDAAPVYGILLDQLSVRKSRLYAKLFINEHFGIQSFYAIVKMSLHQKKPSLLKKLSILNQAPFNLLLIIGLSVLTFWQKFQLFQLEEIQLFEN